MYELSACTCLSLSTCTTMYTNINKFHIHRIMISTRTTQQMYTYELNINKSILSEGEVWNTDAMVGDES